MIRYPSINQYRDAIKNVKFRSSWVGRDEDGTNIFDETIPMPVLEYEGTVKLHGTNASIVFNCQTEELVYQSRERELTLGRDNAGFMLVMKQYEDVFISFFRSIRDTLDIGSDSIVAYGEWCGSGIQKGVALSELPKMFVIFNIKLVSNGIGVWYKLNNFNPEDRNILHDVGIKFIDEFPTYKISIDFSRPDRSQQELIDITNQVEEECPVGKKFFNSMNGATVWLEDGKVCSDATLTEEVRQRCADVLKLDLNSGSSIKLSF